MGITVKIQIYHLAALPIACLARPHDPPGRRRADEPAFTPYREVFITGTRAYREHAYLELVRRVHGPAVAQQVEVHQRRLLDFMTGSGERLRQALGLIDGALTTRAVSVATHAGEIAVPIEMNVALALLLGLPESPDYVATAARRAEQITRMQPEVDWRLAQALARAREEMVKTFSPVLERLDGVAWTKPAVADEGRCGFCSSLTKPHAG